MTDSVLFIYEGNPDFVYYFFIPDTSLLNKNLLGAMRALDGIFVNSDRDPKTPKQWCAWGYVSAALTDNPAHLDQNNPDNQNRFFAALMPYKLESFIFPAVPVSGTFQLIRTGMYL